MIQTFSYHHLGHTVREHWLRVPLSHFGLGGALTETEAASSPGRAVEAKQLSQLSEAGIAPTIEVFAREIVAPGGQDRPHLVFLQGGPGGMGPRFADFTSGWIGRALQDYRVVLLDQRGTGCSTPATAQTLAALPTAELQAAWLAFFRADQIVGDCEALRQTITGGKPWSLLGQSYGGFISLVYLSLAPGGVRESFITGGLPALDLPLTELYRTTYAETARHNASYFAAYPADERVLREICAHLEDEAEYLPTGERLTSRRLRTAGIQLGMQTGRDAFHFWLEHPFVTAAGQRQLSQEFLAATGARLSHVANPLFALVHEPIYAGATPQVQGVATDWAAHLVRNEPTQVAAGFAEDADPLDYQHPYLLTGEHIYPWLFAEDPALQPLWECAQFLAHRTDWPLLYDLEQLAHNTVPVRAAVYGADMFVPRQYSLATAKLVANTRVWVTGDFEHDGLRASAGLVLDHLFTMSS